MTTRERGPAPHEAPPEQSSRHPAADHGQRSPRPRPTPAVERGQASTPAGHPPFPFLLDEETDLNVLDAVRRLIGWARTVEAPAFGSLEWLELPTTDPRWKAALVRAAVAWWAAENDLGLPASPERLDRLVGAELKAASLDVHAAMTEQGEFRRDHVHHSVLARRRTRPTSRPEDHPGGPVPVWGPRDGGWAA